MKELKYITFLLIVIPLIGEVFFLLFPFLYEKQPPYNTAELDKKIGWRVKSNYSHEGLMYSLDKTPYKISISTDINGFRKTRGRGGNKQKILIIGDSFTQAVEVSDDKTYYSYLEETLNAEVYAYGMAGYGTLQEYMILQENLDKLEPRIVVIQFCSNDFIDNEIELEKHSNYYVGLKRPYLIGDLEIEYLSPLNVFEQLLNRTNFIKFCLEKWKRLKSKLGLVKKDSSEQRIAEQGEGYDAYKASKKKTEILLQKIKKELGDRRLIIFSADYYEPQQGDIEEICKNQGIEFIRFPKERMDREKGKNETYSIDGYHWNELGHKIIGEELISRLKEEN